MIFSDYDYVAIPHKPFVDSKFGLFDERYDLNSAEQWPTTMAQASVDIAAISLRKGYVQKS